MSDTAPQTISQQTRLASGDSQIIRFRPALPGVIAVHSLPSPHVAHSETGLLSTMLLRRPGAPKPIAQVNFKVPPPTIPDPSIRLSFNATAADLSAPGDWSCEVMNDSLEPITFSTDVTFPAQRVTNLTASIDMGFLNLLLTGVFDAAAIRIHLESSGDKSEKTYLTVAQDIATLLKIPTFISKAVDDVKKTVSGVELILRIFNLDSDPEYPIVFLASDPLQLQVIIRFDTTSARLVVQNIQILGVDILPDVNIEFFQIELDVSFDGTIEPVCSASAHLAFNNIDYSAEVMTRTQDVIREKLGELARLSDRKQVRATIDGFFVKLLRLAQTAAIHTYKVEGNALIVDYSILA